MHRLCLTTLGALTLAASVAQAQVGSRPEPTLPIDYAPVHPPDERLPATAYVMPDLPDGWNEATAYNGPGFSTRLSFVALVDYTTFGQDTASLEQVGKQRDEWDLRTSRIMTRGELKFRHPVQYMVSLEVKGEDHVETDASKIGFTDWYLATGVGPLGTLSFGKLKEPFIYEMVGDAANLPMQERIMSPFFVTRNIGLRLSNTMAADRMTWAVGWYNDWWVEGQEYNQSANTLVGRLTAVPYTTASGDRYLHLGVSGRYKGPEKGVVRFRGRPESNTASYYVDSGDLPADHAQMVAVETMVGLGPLSVLGEYAHATADVDGNRDPNFAGAYVVASYVLTGEHRPYDKTVAYARRVMPRGRWGAWEVFGRYSHVDIDDLDVHGGVMDKGALGLNWWATRRWKIGADYGLTELDRFGKNGTTQALHMRLQWIY